jgi:hypothetical protein
VATKSRFEDLQIFFRMSVIENVMAGYLLETGYISRSGAATDLLADPELKRIHLGG